MDLNTISNNVLMAKNTANKAQPQTLDTSSNTKDTLSKLNANFDFFLKMLTTQLQYQDPTSPADPSEFTKQLVQYSGVEQQVSTNKKLDQLLSKLGNSDAGALLGYLGRNVELSGSSLPLQNGEAAFKYKLTDVAKDISVNVTDENGILVRSFIGNKAAGTHEVKWDGKDDDGQPMPDGLYKLQITARDSKGQIMETTPSIYGRVTGVENGASGSVLEIMRGLTTTGDKVLSIRERSV